MSLHDDLIAAGLPVMGTAQEGVTVLFTRDLTPAENDVYESIVNPRWYYQHKAGAFAKNIPNWATWTQSDLQNFYDANLSDSAVDALSIPADAKVFLKKQNAAILRIGQMVIALRDHTQLIPPD